MLCWCYACNERAYKNWKEQVVHVTVVTNLLPFLSFSRISNCQLKNCAQTVLRKLEVWKFQNFYIKKLTLVFHENWIKMRNTGNKRKTCQANSVFFHIYLPHSSRVASFCHSIRISCYIRIFYPKIEGLLTNLRNDRKEILLLLTTYLDT